MVDDARELDQRGRHGVGPTCSLVRLDIQQQDVGLRRPLDVRSRSVLQGPLPARLSEGTPACGRFGPLLGPGPRNHRANHRRCALSELP